nr:hypothetical protein [uncultured Carboxylicivirga sp.]
MKKETKSKISGIITLILIIVVLGKYGIKIFNEIKPKDTRVKPPTIEELDEETIKMLGAVKITKDSIIGLDNGLSFIQPMEYHLLTNLTNDTLVLMSKKEYYTIAIHKLDSSSVDITTSWESLRKEYAKNQRFSFVKYPDVAKGKYTLLTKEYSLDNPIAMTVGIAKLLNYNGKYYCFQCETNFMTSNKFQGFASNLLNNAIMIKE